MVNALERAGLSGSRVYTQMTDGKVVEMDVTFPMNWWRKWRCNAPIYCASDLDAPCPCRKPTTRDHDPGDEDRSER